MTPREWCALFAFYLAYIFFGTSVFYHIEHNLEVEKRRDALEQRIKIHEYLIQHLKDGYQETDVLDRVSNYCGKRVTHPEHDTYEPPFIWSFYHSFFFTFIVCSTIGYGNISPGNTFGRIFMIFYALIGIPVHGFVFAYMGDLWGKSFTRLYKKYKDYKRSADSHYAPHQFNLVGQVILYLIPGIIIFIFIPACLFTYFEDWPYDVSVYYAFVTLTTIGFGDYVPTFQAHQEHAFGVAYIFYQVFIILWFFSGVGYLVMIIGFIAKGLRSKKVTRLEKQLATNIKITHQRIWNGVTKDVGFLRKILNEIYLMKVKPVYHEPGDRFTCYEKIVKSQSCPNLTMFNVESQHFPRKRAFSESIHDKEAMKEVEESALKNFGRRQSDTDLQRIDKEKTFGVNALMQPAELLAKVVTALGSIRQNEEMDDESSLGYVTANTGVNCFSDSEILDTERCSTWSLGIGSELSCNTTPVKNRKRAASDHNIPMRDHNARQHEWTWSGSQSHIQDIVNQRYRNSHPKEDLYKATLKKYDSCFTIDMPTDSPTPKAENRGILGRLNLFRRQTIDHAVSNDFKRHSVAVPDQNDHLHYLHNTRKGRMSLFTTPHQYLSRTASGRTSVLSLPPTQEEVLENTTLADLIRAIEAVNTISEVSSTDEGNGSQKVRSKASSVGSLFPSNLSDKSRKAAMPTVVPNGKSRPMLFGSQNENIAPNIINDSSPFIRHPSLRPVNPPPYSPSVEPSTTLKRRFSVRPTSLAYPPGQAPRSGSIQIESTTLQKRLQGNMKPNSLARTQSTQQKTNQWRPAYLREQDVLTRVKKRHGSLSNLHDGKNTDGDDHRRRFDSK